MQSRSMLWIAAGAAALACGMAMSRNARARRALHSRARPEPLNRWENEGGAVPVDENRTAAQVSPAQVSPTTAESYGDEARGR